MALSLAAGTAWANPVGGTVSAGSASISQSGNTLTVDQSSNRVVIDWRGFDIAPNETTSFQQPNRGSIALNRVNSNQASEIDGTLTANGNLIIINPNGVLFGQGAKVDVNGLIATTANIANNAFMAGNMTFSQPGNANASIINAGTITAQQGGLVGLVAPNVLNSGVINAKLGRVQLASGDTFTADLYGDGLMEVGMSDASAQAIKSAGQQQTVTDSGTVNAEGGTIALTAASASHLVNSLITVTGELNAPAVAQQGGSIVIYAEGSNAVAENDPANKGQNDGDSQAIIQGRLNASGRSRGARGGSIDVLADDVGILTGSVIDASGDAGGGTIRIGGDFHGQGTTPTAIATIVQSGTTIDADAITSGNGGNVTVWSDNYTNFAGFISARGGSESGNGGFVETSGHITLDMSGLVDASAPNGQAGTWLMDPDNLTINGNTTTNSGSSPNWTAGSGGGNVLNTDIDTALNAGTSVDLTASGNIEFSANIAKTAGTDATLSAAAGTDIIVDSGISISSSSNRLNVIFDADMGFIGGAIYMASGSSITTNGGNITVGGQESPFASLTAGTGYAVGDATYNNGITINGSINSGGGNIILNGQGWVNTTSGGIGGIGVSITSTGSISSGSGYSNLHGTGGNGGIGSTGGHHASGTSGGTGGAGIYIASGGSLTATGSGAMSMTGTGGNGGVGGTGGNGKYGGNGGAGGNAGTGIVIAGSVNSASGTISLTGTGGQAGHGGTGGAGDYKNSGYISGTGGTGGNGASGLQVTSTGTIASTAGNISMTGNGSSGGTGGSGGYGYSSYSGGTGGNGGNAGNGLSVASNLSTGGSGSVSATGTAGAKGLYGSGGTSANYGVAGHGSYGSAGKQIILTGNTSITSGSGGVSFTGAIDDTNSGTDNLTVNSGSGTASFSAAIGANTAIKTFTLETNATPTITSTVTATGLITIETLGNSLGIGTNASGTVNISGAMLADLTGGSYQFGSTATGAVDINTSQTNITAKNLTFISSGTIYLDKSGDTSPQTLSKTDATNTTLTLQAGTDIITAGAITASGSGTWGITLDSDYAAGGGAIVVNANITTSGGNITMGGDEASPSSIIAGTGYAVGDSGHADGIYVNGATVNSGSGSIILNGQGYAGTAGSYYGVEVNNSTVEASGTGTVTIYGQGGGNASDATGQDTGIYEHGNANGSSTISVVNGALLLHGTGGDTSGTGNGNAGVDLDIYGAIVETTGTGNITITGIGGGGVGSVGIVVNAAYGVTTAVESTDATGNHTLGTITLNGTSSFGLDNSAIVIEANPGNQGFISSVDGDIALNGTSGVSDGGSTGISIGGTSTTGVSTSGIANITLKTNTDISIRDNAGITTAGGSITIASDTGSGGGAITLGDGTTTTTISSNGGAITIGGNGATAGTLNADGTVASVATNFAVGDAYQGVGILIDKATIDASKTASNGGAIIINGQGYASATNNYYGVEVEAGGVVKTNGTGTINVSGTGGGSSNKTGETGVEVTGSNSTIETTGTGLLEVTGKGGSTTGTGDAGVFLADANAIQGTSTGDIRVYGAGGTSTGGTDPGIELSGGSIAGGGNITLYGTGGGTSGSSGNANYGIYLTGTSTTGVNTTGGNIQITGIGGGKAASTTDYGMYILSSGTTNPLIKDTSTTAGAENITLTGTTAGTTTLGIYANNSGGHEADFIEASGGNVTLKSNEDISLNYMNINYNAGGSMAVVLDADDTDTNGSKSGAISLADAIISSNGGNITLGGGTSPLTMAAIGSSGNNNGIYLVDSTLNSGGGAIALRGATDYSGSSSSDLVDGINLNGVVTSVTINAGGGAISLTGTSTTAASFSDGVGSNNAPGSNTIETTGNAGNINITGNSSANFGAGIGMGSSVISATGNGTVTLNGTDTAGQGEGVSFDAYSTIASVSGNISVTAIGHGSTSGNYGLDLSTEPVANLFSTSGGNIIVNANSLELSSYSGRYADFETTGSGNITIGTDYVAEVSGDTGYITAGGNVTIKPYTDTNTVGVGSSASGNLNLSDTLLGAITSATLTIGDSTNTSAMDINTAHTFASPTTFVTNGGNITLDSSVASSDTSGTALTFSDPVLDHGSYTVSTSNGGVTFSGTVNDSTANTDSLTVNAGTGTVTFDSTVGNSAALASLAVTGGSIVLDGSVTTAGNQTYTGAVTLGATDTLNSTSNSANGNIDFTSTVNGAFGLTLTSGSGTDTFGGAVGGSAAPTSLAVTANAIDINGGSITTAGNQTYTGTVSLGANTTLTSTSGGANGNVDFTSTVDGAHTLTVAQGTGTATFGGNVGSSANLSTLDVSGSGTIDLDGNITTSNASATLTGPVVLGANSTISLGSGTFTTGSTINGDYNLNATAATFSLGGAIGGSTALNNVDIISTNSLTLPAIKAATITASTSGSSADITVSGTQTASATSGTPISLSSGRDLKINQSVTASDNTSTDTVAINLDAVRDITEASGKTISSSGAIANITLDSDDTDSNGSKSGAISLSGNIISHGGNITLGGGTSPTTMAAIGSTNNPDGVLITDSSIDASGGTISMIGAAGSTNYDVAVCLMGSTITTSGNISITGTGNSGAGPSLGIGIGANAYGFNDSWISTTGGGTITLTGTGGGWNSSGIVISGRSTVSSVNGNITINAIGDTSDTNHTYGLASTSDPLVNSFTTSGSGNIIVNANSVYISEFNNSYASLETTGTGNITISADVLENEAGATSGRIVSAGSVTLYPYTDTNTMGVGDSASGSLNIANNLLSNITAASLIFGDATNTSALDINTAHTVASPTTFITNGGNITLDSGVASSVSSGTALTFSDPVVMNTASTVSSGNGGIDFASTIDGAHALTVSAGTGAVTFAGAAGGTTPLASLAATGSTITLDGSVTTTGNQTYTGAVTLAGTDTLNSNSGNGGGNISFSSTVNGAYGLTLTSGTGTDTFGGAVGGSAAPISLAATANTIDINGGSLTTAGNQTYTGAVVLGANTTLTSTSGGANGNVDFTSTVDSASGHNYTLTVAQGSGTATFGGNVGSGTALGTLSVSGSGAITVDGNVATSGNQTYTGAVTLSGGGTNTLSTTNSNVTFSSTVDAASTGGESLTVSDGTGTTDFAGVVGGSHALNNLTLTSDNLTFSDKVYGTGTLTIAPSTAAQAVNINNGTSGLYLTGAEQGDIQSDWSSIVIGNTNDTGTLTLGAATWAGPASFLTKSTGSIDVTGTQTGTGSATLSFTGPTTLAYAGTDAATANQNITFGSAVTLTADSTINAGSGTTTFGGTVDGGHALTVTDGGGAVVFDAAAGSGARLSSLAATGSTISLGGNVTTSGTQSYSGAVSLGADDTLTTTNSNVTFPSTIDGAHALTIAAGSGNVSFGGAVGGSVHLASLSVSSASGTAILDAGVTTTGDQSYSGAVTIGGNDTVTSTGSNIVFGGTLDDASGGVHDLTVMATSGNVTFEGAVGSLHALKSLTVDPDTITLDGNVTTTGAQDYADAVILGGNVTLTTTNSNVTFGSTVDGTTSGNQSLTVNDGTGTLSFAGKVGGTTPLDNLTITSDNLTFGDKVYGTGTLTIAPSTAGQAVNINNGSSGLYLTSAEQGDIQIDWNSIVLGNTNDTGTLTLGAVTWASPVSFLTKSTGGIDVTGTQTGTGGATLSFTGPTTLAYAGTDATTSNQAITFNSAVTLAADATINAGSGTTTFASTIDGGHALTVSDAGGSVTFDAAVGGGTPLSTLSVTAGAIDINGGSIITSSDQTYAGAVTLGATTTLDSNNGGLGSNGAIDFTGTVNGAYGLTLTSGSGTDTFGGAVGSGTALLSLSVTAGSIAINGGGVTTSGAAGQIYDGAVTLGAATTLDSNNGGSGSNGAIDFASSVDGVQALTLTSGTGTITFGGAVGGGAPLASLSATGGNISLGGNVTTSGNQSYTGAVALSADDTLTTTNSNVSFSSAVDGGHALTVNAGSGNVTFGGAVGGGAPLASLAATGGNISLDGGVATSGNQSYSGAVVIAGSETLASGSGNIVFGSTLDDASTGAHDLTVMASGGNVTFEGAVGSRHALKSLTVDPASITLDGNVTTTGAQDYADAVILGGNVTLTTTNSNVTFGSTVDGTNGSQSLTVNDGTGTAAFTGQVGGSVPLDNLTITSDNLTFGDKVYGTGTLTIAPSTASQAININNGASGLYLSGTEQGDIQSGWSGVVIGNSSDTGNITVGAAAWAAPVTFLTGSGTVEFAGAQTLGGNTLTAVSNSGNIQLDAGAAITGTATSGYEITLAASGGDFINNTGSDAPLATGTGAYWRVYSRTDGDDVHGASVMNPDTIIGNTTYNTTIRESGDTWFYAGSGQVNLGTLDISANAVSATYGDTLSALTFSCTQSGSACSNGILADLAGALGAVNENGITMASGTLLSHANGFDVASSPFAIVQNTLTFSSGHTGTIVYTGANLSLSAKALTDTGMVASNKAYDGNTVATITNAGSLTGGGTSSGDGLYITGDAVSVTGSAGTFASKNAGTWSVSGTGLSLTGGQASDYTLTTPTATATITPKGLTITADTQSAAYGDTLSTLTYSESGLVAGDTISGALGLTNGIGGTATAGTVLSHANNFDVGGSPFAIVQNTLTAGGNYNITYTGANLTLSAKALTDTGMVASNKVYDGNTGATITNAGSLTGGGTSSGDGRYITGDDVSVTGSTGTFASKNAGTWSVSGTGLSLTGAQASDYTLTTPMASATINAKGLTITADAQSATYGDTLATLTYSESGLVAGDTISGALGVTNGIGGTATAGTVLSHVNNFDVSGSPFAIVQNTLTAGGNYNITYTGANLTLSAKALTDTGFAVAGRAYNGGTNANITSDGSLVGVVGSDDVSISGGTATFGSKNAGLETATGNLTLTGAQATDYTLTAPTANATISKATLTVTADAESATYGDTLATLTYNVSGLQSGDSLTGALGLKNESNTVKNAGTELSHASGFDVTGSSGTVSGNGTYAIVENTLGVSDGNAGGNYNIAYTGANVTLSAKTLTDSGMVASNKVYDGTTTATISNAGTLSGVVGSDVVSLTGSSGTFTSKNAGTWSVLGDGLTLTGAEAADYTLTTPTATATISPKGLTVTAGNESKNEGASDPALGYSYSGLATGDASASFTGALTRDAGEAAGIYTIREGTLAATGNYAIGTFNNGQFTINTPGSGGSGGNEGAALPDSWLHTFQIPVSGAITIKYSIDDNDGLIMPPYADLAPAAGPLPTAFSPYTIHYDILEHQVIIEDSRTATNAWGE